MLKKRTDTVPIIPESVPGSKTDTRPINNDKVRHESVIDAVDSDWVSSAFMVSSKELDSDDALNRFWSTANVKFTDTRPGGNIGINSRPQFTRYSDIRVSGRLTGRSQVKINSSGNHGMGRYYSESIDDNTQTVFIEFGVPKFNTFTRFFSLAIDPNAAFTANTGRANIFKRIGSLLGNVLMITTFPVISTAIWLTGLARVVLPGSSSKFYSLKSTMYMYWSMVSALTTATSVDLGIMPAALTNDGVNKLKAPMKTNKTQMNTLKTLLPELFTYSDNYIDIFAVATRAQVLAQNQTSREYELYTKGNKASYEGYLKQSNDPNVAPPEKGVHSFSNYINELFKLGDRISSEYGVDKSDNITQEVVIGKDANDEDIKRKVDIVSTTETDKTKLTAPKEGESWWQLTEDFFSSAGSYFDATVRDGASHAVFQVEYTGSVNESFSTSVKDPAIKSVMNSTSGASRDVKFNLAGGNVLGETIKYGAEAVSSFISGGLSSVTFGLSNVLASLLGGGYIDVPKQWEDSTVSLPKISYKMSLVTPYGNDLSLLQNIYIPLNMMLAGALPLATGKASYTSPFLCSIYDRGKQFIKLGIIDSLSITRGTTNLGFTREGKPLGVEINFTVLDLSSIMAVPISDGGLFGINMTLDEDHLLSTYLGVITGRSLLSQRYLGPKLKYALANNIANIESSLSSARMGVYFGDSIIGDFFGAFTRPNSSIIGQSIPR